MNKCTSEKDYVYARECVYVFGLVSECVYVWVIEHGCIFSECLSMCMWKVSWNVCTCEHICVHMFRWVSKHVYLGEYLSIYIYFRELLSMCECVFMNMCDYMRICVCVCFGECLSICVCIVSFSVCVCVNISCTYV